MNAFRLIFLVMLCHTAGSINCAGQLDLKIFSEPIDKGYIIYASNGEHAPVSLLPDLKLENLSSGGKSNIWVIPAKTEKFRLMELKMIEAGKKYGYSFQYKATLGDVTILKWDSAFVYDLPFKTGQSYPVTQGYDGSFSHQGENALDFTMPEGTEVLAAREGVVIEVEQRNNQACLGEECQKYNNYILILHPDGTIANYSHLQVNASRVKEGDRVKKGDVIALSGNTGWTSGPHLHFACYLPGFEKKRSLKTAFRIANGKDVDLLKENVVYTRMY